MTKVFLMRHAKAAKAAAGMGDFDRPLEASGKADAHRTGRCLLERWGAPAHILCSPALRTRETLAALDLPAMPTDFDRSLFSGEAGDYLEALRAADAASILLVGHNPSIHAAALMLAGSGDPDLRGTVAGKFPTSALAVLDLPGPLATLAPGSCALEAFVMPDGPSDA